MKSMKSKKAIVIAFFLFVALGISFGQNSVTYTLQKGETLYSIAKKYNIPYEALAAANRITDPTKVKAGTVLIIPSVHQVVKGETLYGLAQRYGISIADLLAANKLSSDYVLKVGDTLVIPAQEPVQGTSVASSTSKPAPSASASASQPTVVPQSAPAAPAAQSAPSAQSAPAGATGGSGAAGTGNITATPPAAAGSTAPAPTAPSVPLPSPVKTQDRVVDMNLNWPATGKAMYLDGKLEGVMIRVKPGETAKAIASGTVVSAGPSRGFNQVVFVQAKSGYVYVYGGNEALSVKTGDRVNSGTELGKIGLDPKDGTPIAYFFVFRNGQPIDPALAPRD